MAFVARARASSQMQPRALNYLAADGCSGPRGSGIINQALQDVREAKTIVAFACAQRGRARAT